MKCRISRPADRDLDEIWLFIARSSGSEEVANRVDEAIHDGIKRLGRDPLIGHVRAEVDDKSIRFWAVH